MFFDKLSFVKSIKNCFGNHEPARAHRQGIWVHATTRKHMRMWLHALGTCVLGGRGHVDTAWHAHARACKRRCMMVVEKQTMQRNPHDADANE